ncbi:MAG TPA: 30S ribosomal protein S3 [Candidatus Paceibacterota bacterium]
MTHKVNPYAHRLGILRDWRSRWFGIGKTYKEFLRGDVAIREYLKKRLRGLYVSSVGIERNGETVKIILKTARPGIIIGRQGEGSVKLKSDILSMMQRAGVAPKSLKIDIEEIRFPETDASVVGQMVVEGLSKRLPFRRILKQTIDKVMANKVVKGVRIEISGRIGGAEIARKESLKQGMIPLQTLRADIDFARETAILPYGTIGVKVWIYRGEIFSEKQGARQA